jgi:hypothetical protein
VVAGKVHRVDLNTGDIEILDIFAKDDPTIQPGAKDFIDERNLLPVFRFVTDLVGELWEKIEPLRHTSSERN